MTNLKKNKGMTPLGLGEIVLYQSDDGMTTLDVRLKDETVWLTQKQIASLFNTERSVVTKHINNVFRTDELSREAVCAKFAHTATDGKVYQTSHYNLDVIIAVGYRINARRGTQFRIWATGVLKEHLVRGYTLNQKRLAEKGTDELRQALALLTTTLIVHDMVSEEGQAVLDIISRYSRTWQLLLQYDENKLPLPEMHAKAGAVLGIDAIRDAVGSLKKELRARKEATSLFGQACGHGLESIIGAVRQFFDNRELVTLALLTASCDPGQKTLMIRLIVNLIVVNG